MCTCVHVGSILTYCVCCYSSGEDLAYTLKAFVELMDHSIVSWDVLDPAFIKTVSGLSTICSFIKTEWFVYYLFIY